MRYKCSNFNHQAENGKLRNEAALLPCHRGAESFWRRNYLPEDQQLPAEQHIPLNLQKFRRHQNPIELITSSCKNTFLWVPSLARDQGAKGWTAMVKLPAPHSNPWLKQLSLSFTQQVQKQQTTHGTNLLRQKDSAWLHKSICFPTALDKKIDLNEKAKRSTLKDKARESAQHSCSISFAALFFRSSGFDHGLYSFSQECGRLELLITALPT